MSSQFTYSIKQNIRHSDVKQYLTELGVTPAEYFMTNCKLLSTELSNRGFTGRISDKNIRKFIDRLPRPPPLEEESQLPEEDEEEQPPLQSPPSPPPPTPLQRYVDSPEYKSREQKRSDDDLFTKLSRENAELRAKNKRLEDEHRVMRAELAEQHRELREELEAHEKSIMEMETFTDTRSQLSSEERLRIRAGDISSITDGLVTTIAHSDDYKRNAEMVTFIRRHKPERIECPDGFIPLFEVNDENQQAFSDKIAEVYRKNGNSHNVKKMVSHGDYHLYYINNLSSIEALFEALDVVYHKHKDTPFKIMCDSGYILEQYTDDNGVAGSGGTDECSYRYQPPDEMVTGRSTTTTITEPHDLELYKHYIYSYITEKTEITHENSRNRYCAIVSFMFKVVPLQRTGKRTSNLQLAPEYEWLLHDNHIVTIECDYNICVFNTIAAGLLLHEQSV